MGIMYNRITIRIWSCLASFCATPTALSVYNTLCKPTRHSLPPKTPSATVAAAAIGTTLRMQQQPCNRDRRVMPT